MGGEIFISYRRADEGWARLLHAQLKAEGADAWYDAHVGAGQDWRSATANALERSRIFVLLFSRAASQSEDIAKELAAATFSKKLIVPVRIEDIQPTGAFLYELASRNWVNAYDNTEAKIAELAKSLADLIKSGVQDESILPFDRNAGDRATSSKALSWLKRRPRAVAAATLAVVAAGLAGALLLQPKSAAPVAAGIAVAVQSFDVLSEGPEIRHFADALTDQIITELNSRQVQVLSRDAATSLQGLDRDKQIKQLGVQLVLDGTVQSDGKAVKISVHIDDAARRTTLWSGVVEGAEDEGEQLQAQIATRAVRVVICSRSALKPTRGLSDLALISRYLQACDSFVSGSAGSPQRIHELVASYHELIAKAPEFVEGHLDLARIESILAGLLPADQAAELRAEAKREARAALLLDPKAASAYASLSLLLEPTRWAEREALLREGLSVSPQDDSVLAMLAELLAGTGRLEEALTYAQKAAAINPDWASGAGLFAAASGSFEPAISDLSRQFKLQPRSYPMWISLVRSLEYAERWGEARAVLADPFMSTSRISAKFVEIEEVFLIAAESRRAPDVARTRRLALAAPNDVSVVSLAAINALSVLGYVDDAFSVAANYKVGLGATIAETSVLFAPNMAALRRDRRFMKLAAQIALTDFWRASGKWPDFCEDSGLPYDCRTEAERLASAK